MSDVEFVRFYPTELDRVLRAPGGPVGRWFGRYSREVAVEAQALASMRLTRRTGRYAQGFKVKVNRGSEGFSYTISNKVRGKDPQRKGSYAAVIEDGSRPHVIRPRRSNTANGMLVFNVNGKKIVTKQVNHPGTKAQHILRDAERIVRKRRGL